MPLKKTPLQPKGTTLKRSKPINRSNSKLNKGSKLRSKPKSQQTIELERAQQEAMWELFERHWNSKPHVCECCDSPIWGENLTIYHHHCWPKSTYPQYMYMIEGLILVCWQCHTNIEAAHINEDTRKKIEEVKRKVLEISG